MTAFRGVLIDLGGVVYEGDTVIAGSIQAVERLQAAKIPYRFLTNTTSRPLSGLLSKLGKLGVPVDEDHIFTPSRAARSYIEKNDLRPHFLVRPSLMEDFQELPEGEMPAVVIADAREGFSYEALNDAFRRVNAGAAFIALASNRNYRDEDGELSLDVGAFVAALEYGSGIKAVVLGKPSEAFFRLAVEDMGLERQDVVMIGDDAEFDVAAAIEAGLSGYLVRTGKWQPDSTDRLDTQPTGTFSDLKSAVDAIVGSPG